MKPNQSYKLLHNVTIQYRDRVHNKKAFQSLDQSLDQRYFGSASILHMLEVSCS